MGNKLTLLKAICFVFVRYSGWPLTLNHFESGTLTAQPLGDQRAPASTTDSLNLPHSLSSNAQQLSGAFQIPSSPLFSLAFSWWLFPVWYFFQSSVLSGDHIGALDGSDRSDDRGNGAPQTWYLCCAISAYCWQFPILLELINGVKEFHVQSFRPIIFLLICLL